MEAKMKTRIKIILIATVLTVGLFLMWFYVSERGVSDKIPDNDNVNIDVPIEKAKPVLRNNANISAAAEEEITTPENQEERSLAAFVSSFTQRFGSFSNQGNNDNIRDLMPMMTLKMKTWAESVLKTRQESKGEYYSIKVKTLNYDIRLLEDDRAELMLSTQQQEVAGGGFEKKVFNKDVLVKLIKIKERWLVNEFYWQ